MFYLFFLFVFGIEVLFALVFVFARQLGLHADNAWTCRMYTCMLVGIFVRNGIFLQIGWTASRQCPVWFCLVLVSYYYPFFPPKKKSHAEKTDSWDRLLAQKDSVNEELLKSYNRIFEAANVEGDDDHFAVCVAVTNFLETSNRLPNRLPKWQAGDTDEQQRTRLHNDGIVFLPVELHWVTICWDSSVASLTHVTKLGS